MAIGVTLDPTEVADARTELDIHNEAGNYQISEGGPDWGTAEIEAYLAERRYGSSPVSYSVPNRTITIPLRIKDTGGTSYNRALTTLQKKVARFQDEGGWIKRVTSEGTKLYADVIDASFEMPERQTEKMYGFGTLTLTCLPDFYTDLMRSKKFTRAVAQIMTWRAAIKALVVPDPDYDTNTLRDLSPVGAPGSFGAMTPGSLLNSATVGKDLLGGEDALSLDGISKYGSIPAITRRNLVPNPNIEYSMSNWTFVPGSFTGGSMTRVTTYATQGTASARIVGTKDNSATLRTIYGVTDNMPVTPGTTYSARIRGRVVDAGSQGLLLGINWLNSSSVFISATQSSTMLGTGPIDISVTGVAPAGAAYAVIYPVVSSNTALDTVDYNFDLAQFTAESTVGRYFDGDGYFDANGNWVVSNGECGWLGSAGSSASDIGPYANGAVRTFVGVAQVTANAGSGVVQTLYGSNLGGGTGTIVYLYNNAGVRTFGLTVNGTQYLWNLTANEIAATAAGQIFAYWLEFNEPSNTATLRINWLPAVAKASVNAQHAAGQTTVQTGAYASGSSSFQGNLGPSAILSTAITSAEWDYLLGNLGMSADDNSEIVTVEDRVPGDYYARTRTKFTDKGSQRRKAVIFGMQSRTFDPAPTAKLVYEAEALKRMDSATLGTDSDGHGGASNNVVNVTTAGEEWVPALSTVITALSSYMTHWGNYRVIVRAKLYYAALRLEYSVGDSNVKIENDPVNNASAFSSEFGVYDLGEIRIPKAKVGSQHWEGLISVKHADPRYGYGVATVPYITGTASIDKIWIVPTESLSIAKPRKTLEYVPGKERNWLVRDTFNGKTNNAVLGGQSLPEGGAWTAYGDADDFFHPGNNVPYITRNPAAIDTAGIIGRTQVDASTNGTGLVGVAVHMSNENPTRQMWGGPVARFVNGTNFLQLGAVSSAGSVGLSLVKMVGGVATTIGQCWLGDDAADYDVALVVDTDGKAYCYYEGELVMKVYDQDLSGTFPLATGAVGFFDYAGNTGTGNKIYSNFRSWIPSLECVCMPGGDLHLRHDGAWRTAQIAEDGITVIPVDKTTSVYVEGQLPRAPVSGLEARPVRSITIPTTSDMAVEACVDPTPFTLDISHQPSYLFVPDNGGI